MSPTLLLYILLFGILAASAIYLIVRDLNAADPNAPAPAGPALSRLTEPVGDTEPRALTDRLDHRFRRLVYQSGLDLSAEPAFLLIVLCGVALGGAVFVWRDDLLLGIMGMLIGMAAPWTYFIVSRRQRIKALREQLPDVMDLMSRSVRAGETLDQAIENVGKQSQAPLGIEFRRCARQLEMGLALPAAMRSLTHRAPIMEMRILSTALNVQRRTGGNLATTLERLSGVIRDRLSFHRQFMAQTGASRMATILISLAGPAVFSYMMFAQPDYMGQFFELPGGWALLGIAGVLQIVGLAWVIGLLRNDY